MIMCYWQPSYSISSFLAYFHIHSFSIQTSLLLHSIADHILCVSPFETGVVRNTNVVNWRDSVLARTEGAGCCLIKQLYNIVTQQLVKQQASICDGIGIGCSIPTLYK